MDKRIISEIWIYPIKSLGGIRISSSVVLPKGLAFDRRWMLVDEQQQFMSQRSFPEMSQFRLSGMEGDFQIHFGEEAISLPLHYSEMAIQATVWDDTVEVFEVSAEISEWFSSRLRKQCRLVYFPEKSPRMVDPRYAVGNDQVSLADGYPLLFIGQASLEDVNSRLEEPVLMNRFRPNIVFTGGLPYEEDSWKEIRIGQGRFAGVKPCSRCVMITIDQATGKKSAEPLKTLSQYRQRNNKVYLGQNVLALDADSIHVGQEIEPGR